MPAFTTNFNLPKPDVGADDNDWGDFLNTALDAIDAKLKALELPVGSLYLATVATNPATLLGYGTWVAYAAGRALVGVGTADAVVWAAGDLKGAATHTLTTAELPAHAHGAGTLSADASGNHSHGHTFSVNSASLTGSFTVRVFDTDGGLLLPGTSGVFSASSGGSSRTKVQDTGSGAVPDAINFNGSHGHFLSGGIVADGTHSHSVTGSTANAGSGNAHNNVQPSIAVYVWRRTA